MTQDSNNSSLTTNKGLSPIPSTALLSVMCDAALFDLCQAALDCQAGPRLWKDNKCQTKQLEDRRGEISGLPM